MRSCCHPVLFLAFLCSSAYADLPLTVENLISDQGQVRADVSITYANVESQSLLAGDPITVQTGPATFVTIPTRVGERLTNTDTTVLTMGLRYGLSQRVEVYTRASAMATRQRSSFQGSSNTYTDAGLIDAWAGLNLQIKPDDTTPALLAFAEVALREKHQLSTSAFRSALVGLTTYKAIDPVVLSLTAAYRINEVRDDGGIALKPGNSMLLNPGVAFAVNDRITLSTGFQWTQRQANRRSGVPQGHDRTSVDILMGVGYGLDKGNSLNTTVKFNASGRSGAELRANWLHTF
ncbi:hypothetical protein [uncultured Hydrogenophaga sp.]|uniref:hypothetical protein n=1 Tax=uncultured Hydrogenophaga sp. TaxID=199683 RepID=UPI00265D978A|nr:hypothetical protein [uncultured Hydrogenophaga sp.]